MSSQTPDDDRTVIRPSGTPSTAGTPVLNAQPAPTPFMPAGGAAAGLSASAPRAPPNSASNATHMPAGNNAASSAGDSGNALPVGTYLGEFELTSVLGEGGFGIVYLAWDHSLERRVALKEYMPSALSARVGQTQVQVKSARHRDTFDAGLKSFVNEAKLLAQFDHPSLVKVYRFWEANGTAYMVMPFYEGITLKDKLRAMGSPPDEAWLMALLAPLTEALAVIHAESCFHRDIAPDNVILLGSAGKPLLLDFGAARRVIGDMTQALTVILKPGYAPVEQYAEAPNMKQGAWTDVYALAASVHYAIMGRTPPTSVGRLMSDSYVPLEQAAADRYSDQFLQAIDKALRVRPEERTQTIDELRADLGLSAARLSSQETQLLGTSGATTMRAQAESAQRGATQFPDARPTVMQAPAAAGSTASGTSPARAGKGLWVGLGLASLAAVVAGAYFMTAPGAPTAPQAGPAAPPATVAVVADPAPAAPVAAAPAAPARLDIRDEFDKVLSRQTPGFLVEATPSKQQYRIGKDKLAFSVKSSRDGHVYVLLLGPDGSLLQLFPNTQASGNRIKAGQTLALPQSSWPLMTAEPAGPEHFLAIVSQQPRDFSALSTERDDMFLKLPTGERAAALAAQWSAPTPLLLGLSGTPGSPSGCTGTNCDDFGAARFTVDIVN